MKKVFVSSTSVDLSSHRRAVRDGLRQLGLVDVTMDTLGARDERPKAECLRLVREESDLFVGIYAHRYGFVPEGDEASITESEYEAATLRGLPRFVYLIDPDHPWPPRYVDHGSSGERLERFRARLLQTHICQRFTTEDQLTARVVADLGRHLAIREAPRVGPKAELPDIGIESLRGRPAETPDHWSSLRNGIYESTRGVFIVHVIEPSKTPGQDFDVFIYLRRHESVDLSDIRVAEFFMGKYWGNRVFPAVLQAGGVIGISTAAYGTFLCICRVTFDDGVEALLQRYIDFEALL